MKNYDYLHTSRYGGKSGEVFVDDDIDLKSYEAYLEKQVLEKAFAKIEAKQDWLEEAEKAFSHIETKESTKMYTITRPGKGMPRSLSGVKFPSYEKARQAIRKWVRSNMNSDKYNMTVNSDAVVAVWDGIARNPPNVISALGFKIKSTTGV